MKSSFLLVITLLCSTVVWGQSRSTRSGVTRSGVTRTGSPGRKTSRPIVQTKKKTYPVRRQVPVQKPVQKPVQTPAKTETVSKTEVIVNKTSFEKFSDRLRISYFGAYQGSSLGQWDTAALDEHGVKDRGYVHNVFNQLSFNMNFGWKMNFVLNPRWTINTASTKYHAANQKSIFQVEDMLIGFQGVILSSEDKKFNWWMRVGTRLPTSRPSRANDITYQPETYSQFSYDFNTTWQLGSYLQTRFWVYNQQYNLRRYRIYTAPYLQYSISDDDKIAIWYENYSENRNNLKSFNGKNPNLQEYWQNAMISYSRNITPTVNFMPFIGYFLNTTYASDRPLDPAWVGFWLSWQIK